MSTLVQMVTASGEPHGLINVMTNNVPFDDFKNFKPEHKKEMERRKKDDSRIVKAQYINSSGKHERLEKTYCRYSGDPIQMWKFIPGRTYEVPMGLIKDVEESQNNLKRRSGLVSIDGEPIKRDESPLEKDEEADWIHKFIPVSFQAAA